MSSISPLVVPPQFEQQFFEFAMSVPVHAPLRLKLAPLARELAEILGALDDPNVDAAQLVDRWNAWCDSFGEISGSPWVHHVSKSVAD